MIGAKGREINLKLNLMSQYQGFSVIPAFTTGKLRRDFAAKFK